MFRFKKHNGNKDTLFGQRRDKARQAIGLAVRQGPRIVVSVTAVSIIAHVVAFASGLWGWL